MKSAIYPTNVMTATATRTVPHIKSRIILTSLLSPTLVRNVLLRGPLWPADPGTVPQPQPSARLC